MAGSVDSESMLIDVSKTIETSKKQKTADGELEERSSALIGYFGTDHGGNSKFAFDAEVDGNSGCGIWTAQ